MVRNCILLTVTAYKNQRYYLNPEYAINGEEVDMSLVRMFRDTRNVMLEERSYNIEGTIYEKFEVGERKILVNSINTGLLK